MNQSKIVIGSNSTTHTSTCRAVSSSGSNSTRSQSVISSKDRFNNFSTNNGSSSWNFTANTSRMQNQSGWSLHNGWGSSQTNHSWADNSGWKSNVNSNSTNSWNKKKVKNGAINLLLYQHVLL